MTQPDIRSILIAGFGNIDAGDDAVGSRVIKSLRQRSLPEGVEAVDLGGNPSALLDHLPDREALILIDAAHIPDAPAGLLFDINWNSPDRPQLISDVRLSTHGSSVGDQLALAESLGMLPRVVRLIAITIGEGPIGSMICPAVERQVPVAARQVIMRCRNLLFGEPIKPLAPRVDQQQFAQLNSTE